jgi:VanZ family protein
MFPSRWTRLLYWLPPIGWATAIFVASSLSFSGHEPGFAQEDKFFHGGLFALLSMLFFFALSYERRLPRIKAALLAILLTSAYGALDEFHQRFTPDRLCDVRDWMADTAGAAVVLVPVLTQRRKGAKGA